MRLIPLKTFMSRCCSTRAPMPANIVLVAPLTADMIQIGGAKFTALELQLMD